jgi:hypothetical protein
VLSLGPAGAGRRTSKTPKCALPLGAASLERGRLADASTARCCGQLVAIMRGTSESMRRFTRLTNAFSKKVENHAAMVAIHFMYDNFGRTHKTLG